MKSQDQIRIEELERALRSLVIGVEELQDAWPRLELPSEGLHNDLIGFIAQKALKR